MKRLGYILTGMLAVLVLAGGCFITDQNRITETMPTTADAKLDDMNFYLGDAHILEGAQTATIFGDGYSVESVNFMTATNNFPIDEGECPPDCCNDVRNALEAAVGADGYVAMDLLSKWANACKHLTNGKNIHTAAQGICTLLNHVDALEGSKITSQQADDIRTAVFESCVNHPDDPIALPCEDDFFKGGAIEAIEQGCSTIPQAWNQNWAMVNVGHSPSINYFHSDLMCDLDMGACSRRVEGLPVRQFPYPADGTVFTYFILPTGNALCDRFVPGVLVANTSQPTCSAGLGDYGIDPLQAIQALSTATETEEGLLLTLTADNSSLTLSQGEISSKIEYGDAEFDILVDPITLRARFVLDLTDARFETPLASYLDFLNTAAPGTFTAHITYNEFSATISDHLGIDPNKQVADGIAYYLNHLRENASTDQKMGSREGRSFF